MVGGGGANEGRKQWEMIGKRFLRTYGGVAAFPRRVKWFVLVEAVNASVAVGPDVSGSDGWRKCVLQVWNRRLSVSVFKGSYFLSVFSRRMTVYL